MPSQNGKGGQGGPWGSGVKPDPDIKDQVRHGQDRFKQIMPVACAEQSLLPSLLWWASTPGPPITLCR